MALAISAMAFPSCCILASDTVGANVGINVGADEEVDGDHYFIVSYTKYSPHYHISAFIR